MTRKSRAIRSIWKDELRKLDMNDQDKRDLNHILSRADGSRQKKTDPPERVLSLNYFSESLCTSSTARPDGSASSLNLASHSSAAGVEHATDLP